MSATFHVDPQGADTASGTPSSPLRTISKAAELAKAGDAVIVHGGEYREWVRPPRGGSSERRRITFEAAPGENVVIKGSERVSTWQPLADGVWQAEVPAAVFGDFNPFAHEVEGDWTVYPSQDSPRKHLGDVYLDGVSCFEVESAAAVSRAQARTQVTDHWTGVVEQIANPERTKRVWYAEVGEEKTTIWLNAGDVDPNEILTEINVRPAVFYPTAPGVDYITVRGFELAQAASPWAPPTAAQPGLIGPNWAEGWVIEDNHIHDAKCVGIAIGKEASTGDNFATERLDKPGYQYQLESVFAARHIGWSKERIGSHVIRANTIHDCGQAGIVGHLGCVFSTIENNHIYQVGTKREFYGYEIGGIKLHAAIDVQIRANHIHDCSLGLWLDWQTQGTRISRNVFAANRRDMFVEVSNGPYLVEHNILASPVSIENFSQGGAYIHNLICGTVAIQPVLERPTPYHLPHSTEVAGYAAIHGGDDRWVGNLFAPGTSEISAAYGSSATHVQNPTLGTAGYNGHPANLAEYLAQVSDPSRGDHERFMGIKQPAYIWSNAYAGSAQAYDGEESATRVSGNLHLEVATDAQGHAYLDYDLPEDFARAKATHIGGRDLERVRFVDADFEEADGTPARMAEDLLGEVKAEGQSYPVGPIASLAPGTGRIQLR